jgi:hypothetical protein
MKDKPVTSPETIEEMKSFMGGVQSRHSEIISLRANVAAINRMLISRGRGEELLESLKIVVAKFEGKSTGDSGE